MDRSVRSSAANLVATPRAGHRSIDEGCRLRFSSSQSVSIPGGNAGAKIINSFSINDACANIDSLERISARREIRYSGYQFAAKFKTAGTLAQ